MKSSTVYSNSVQRCTVLSGPVLSCPAHSSPVSPTQVKSHLRKFNAMYFHLEHFNSIKENCNNPVPWSAVLSSPVQSSPVQSSPTHWSTVQFISIWSAMSSAMHSGWVKWSRTLSSAVLSIRVKCHSEKATFRSQSAQSGPVTAV